MGSFPAIQFMISNLYGQHVVDGDRLTKPTVLNFFLDCALAGESLTVYEPGSQSRNFVHVADVASAFRCGLEVILERASAGETDSRTYEIATDEDPSVREIAELVADVVEETGDRPPVELVENPRGERLVKEFAVDTSRAQAELGWEPECSVEASVRELVTSLSE